MRGETIVYQAVKKGHYDCLVALLEAKADPNFDEPRLNDTPLHYAVKYGAMKMAAALVRAGAQLDKELKNGWTPLHVAAQESPIEILDILLNGQKDLPKKLLEARDNQGNTALHLAVGGNRADNAAWLLKYKANPLLFNTQGNTALHEAAKAGFIEIIKILLEAGISAELKNEEGLSARQLAESNNQDAAMQVLSVAENKPTKFKKKKKETNLILKQQELIYQQKKEIEQLRLDIKKINQASKQQLSEIKQLVQEGSKSGSDIKKSLAEFYGLQPFFSQSISPHVNAIAASSKLNLSYLQQCYHSRSDGRFKRIENVAHYIGNYTEDMFPKLSLQEALALTLQESINLQRCYPLIADSWMIIEQVKALKDQESDNVAGIGLSIVRKKLLLLDEVIHLTKSESDFLYHTYSKNHDLEKSVAVFKEHRAETSTSSQPQGQIKLRADNNFVR